MPFAEPEQAGGPYPRDIVGHLLMVWPVNYIDDAPSKFSGRTGQPSDVIVVDVVDLDEIDPITRQPGLLSRNAWWRPGRLIGSLKRRLGSSDPVLAWMTMGTASAGFNAPFELATATGDRAAVAKAEAWLAANPDFRPSNHQVQDQGPQPEWSRPEQTPPAPEPSRVRSELERIAAQSQRGADRLPDPSPERFPY